MVPRFVLRFGSTGPAVTLLQQALNLGKTALPMLAEDGIFGPKTRGRVIEHQRQKGLVQDGVVGEFTHGSLEELYKVVATVIKLVPPPPGVEAVRAAIRNVAFASVASLGWPEIHEQLPPPESGRILTRRAFGVPDASGAMHRHGGFALATIFQIAGDVQATGCLNMSKGAQDLYAQFAKPPKELQNTIDLHDWCARFCTYVYRTAGLKIDSANGAPKYGLEDETRDFVSVKRLKDLRPGDMGIVSPAGRNHHFLIMDTNGTTFSTVDGNAGKHFSIIHRQYTIANTSRDERGFYRINTNEGVEPFTAVSPNYTELLKS